MSIIFSESEQHAADIKLALSLEKPLIIDELVVVKNLNLLYDILKNLDFDRPLHFDVLLMELISDGKKEGIHTRFIVRGKDARVKYETTIIGVGRDRKYIYEFIQ